MERVSGKNLTKKLVCVLATGSLDVAEGCTIFFLLGEDRCLEAPEGVVLRWGLRWLAHDPSKREQHRPALLSMIRFPLLSSAELDSLGDDVTGLCFVVSFITLATVGGSCPMHP